MNMQQKILLENSLEHCLIALGVFVAVFTSLKFLQHFFIVRLNSEKRGSKRFDNIFRIALSSTKTVFFLTVSLYLASGILQLTPKHEQFLDIVMKLCLFLQIGIWGNAAIHFFLLDYTAETMKKDPGRATTVSAMGYLLEILLWIIVALLALNNFGVNVSALIAGLGIGGIAIALAVQNVLSDLLASLAIVLDKPFVIGDSITVDVDSGTVEHIGLKTTRLKSLNGEQLIFSNSELLKSRIRNFKRMTDRRVSFKIALSYDTSVETLRKIPGLVEKCIAPLAGLHFDRCHLVQLDLSTLNFEIVYWVHSPDQRAYLDLHHKINLSILETFQREKIAFSSAPTQYILRESTNEKN